MEYSGGVLGAIVAAPVRKRIPVAARSPGEKLETYGGASVVSSGKTGSVLLNLDNGSAAFVGLPVETAGSLMI